MHEACKLFASQRERFPHFVASGLLPPLVERRTDSRPILGAETERQVSRRQIRGQTSRVHRLSLLISGGKPLSRTTRPNTRTTLAGNKVPALRKRPVILTSCPRLVDSAGTVIEKQSHTLSPCYSCLASESSSRCVRQLNTYTNAEKKLQPDFCGRPRNGGGCEMLSIVSHNFPLVQREESFVQSIRGKERWW